ncbi:type II toxin-antitoxin system YafQ family toxin [Candidatus Peregrinibacteria bacterium]|nr:type II toxin-antitoxin system YafQ family toxin [Candidatus Peregrinibacteria bacterium]
MKITSSTHFDNQYIKIVKKKPGVKTLLEGTIMLLGESMRAPSLSVHKLSGRLNGYWAFSLAHDLRVIFEWKNDKITLVNIGTHDEIYR